VTGNLAQLWDICDDTFRTLLQVRLQGGGVARSRTPVPAADEQRPWIAGDRGICRSISINAPSADVWPWLRQLMRGGGMCGWPSLESPACRSADYLLDDVPDLRAGDHIDGCLVLTSFRPLHWIVWRAGPSATLLGLSLPEFTFGYGLQETDPGKTRLAVRTYPVQGSVTDQAADWLLGVFDFILPAHQLPAIKRNVETYAARLTAGATNRGTVARHQACPLTRGEARSLLQPRTSPPTPPPPKTLDAPAAAKPD
jgi:hypothetical protein